MAPLVMPKLVTTQSPLPPPLAAPVAAAPPPSGLVGGPDFIERTHACPSSVSDHDMQLLYVGLVVEA